MLKILLAAVLLVALSAFAQVPAVNGTVTVKVCAIIGLTPTSSTYNVRVVP